MQKINKILDDDNKIQKIKEIFSKQGKQMKPYPNLEKYEIDSKFIFQNSQLQNLTNMTQRILDKNNTLIVILAIDEVIIILHTYEILIQENKEQINKSSTFKILKTVKIQYRQQLDDWESGLKYEKEINQDKARFLHKQYKKNFGQEIKEDLQSLDIGDGLNDDINIYVGGAHGYLYTISLDQCLEQNTQDSSFLILFQAHMNTITTVKAFNPIETYQYQNLVLTASKDGLMKVSNPIKNETYIIIQELFTLHQGVTINHLDLKNDNSEFVCCTMGNYIYVYKFDNEAVQVLQKQEEAPIGKEFVIKKSQFLNKNLHQENVTSFIDQVQYCDNYGIVSKDVYGSMYKFLYELNNNKENTFQENSDVIVINKFASPIPKEIFYRRFGIHQQQQKLYIGNEKGQIHGFLLDDLKYQKTENPDKYLTKQVTEFQLKTNQKYIKTISIPTFSQSYVSEPPFGYAITVNALAAFPLQQQE